MAQRNGKPAMQDWMKELLCCKFEYETTLHDAVEVAEAKDYDKILRIINQTMDVLQAQKNDLEQRRNGSKKQSGEKVSGGGTQQSESRSFENKSLAEEVKHTAYVPPALKKISKEQSNGALENPWIKENMPVLFPPPTIPSMVPTVPSLFSAPLPQPDPAKPQLLISNARSHAQQRILNHNPAVLALRKITPSQKDIYEKWVYIPEIPSTVPMAVLRNTFNTFQTLLNIIISKRSAGSQNNQAFMEFITSDAAKPFVDQKAGFTFNRAVFFVRPFHPNQVKNTLEVQEVWCR